MVAEAGGLPRQPTENPYVIVRAVIEPLIPAPFGAQPNFIHPSIRRREQRDDVGEFLRRSWPALDAGPSLLPAWSRPRAQVVYINAAASWGICGGGGGGGGGVVFFFFFFFFFFFLWGGGGGGRGRAPPPPPTSLVRTTAGLSINTTH